MNVYNKTYTYYMSTITVCTTKHVSTEPHWDKLFCSECPGACLKKVKWFFSVLYNSAQYAVIRSF